MSDIAAYRIHVTGIVQGVGFRPFIYGLALRHALLGWVRNTSAGVDIEVSGPPDALDAFAHEIAAEAPPLARIEQVSVTPIAPNGYAKFEILHSAAQEGAYQPISPDVCICDDCLREIFDPADRRYRYAFTNCTNCGPRFTIIQDIPYDRPETTMAPFEMCPACRAEYEDPLNRRFHAQPNACPDCGPRLQLVSAPSREALPGWDALPPDEIASARALLAAGHVVAIKGLGGFHLACDATNPDAVRTLRQRKGRAAKPFAVMLFDLPTVERYCEVSPAAAEALTSRERPIVLLPLKPGTDLAGEVAPELSELGVMLPYTPLHYLLLEPAEGFPPALVMTSGNFSEEPIATRSEDALDRLAPLADAFLLHDRAIHIRCDDSVVRVLGDTVLPLRRSRGYAPGPLALPFESVPLLAAGAEMKNTFCLARDRSAFMSQHIGDLANYDALQSYEHSVEHMERLFRVRPEVIAHDAHPDYRATRYAIQRAERDGLPHVAVQHHHAHLASVLAEHDLPPGEQAIGVIFDGTGLGPDGAIWGGEILIGGYEGYQRFAHLRYIPLPGGDAATLRPYRAALAHLWAADIPWESDLAPVIAATAQEQTILGQQIEKRLNAPDTSSMGRLFDAAAALAGLLQTVTYEAQAAIWFEARVDPDEMGVYPFDLRELGGDAPTLLDPAPALRALIADGRAGVPISTIAARFHNGVAHIVRDACLLARERTGLDAVALSGGVWQNVTLLQKAVPLLRTAGFTVYTHRLVPPNDGGLALGQTAVAACAAANGF
ncbi:carbamoyltransferase HypF [Aggregatilinea lenta]|uniref:carbamoyltransferase HypF n=1 Tax=Aggregatilinea lenta TaxID=913108 RepID=UPI000E5A73ED|nr:carbamoyltransferase HypF [Aggregatilinea lenta]